MSCRVKALLSNALNSYIHVVADNLNHSAIRSQKNNYRSIHTSHSLFLIVISGTTDIKDTITL